MNENHRIPSIVLPWAFAILGCVDPRPTDVELPPEQPGEVCSTTGTSCVVLPTNNQVDVLFVVDAGPNALVWQRALSEAMPAWLDAIGSGPTDIDLRVGIVPAQAPAACERAPSGRGSDGRFVHQSCEARADWFASSEALDVCVDRCDGVELQGAAWWAANEGTALSALAGPLQCASIVGDGGCDVAEPLGTVRAVAEHPTDDGAFFREFATAVVVLLTPNDDCTAADEAALAGLSSEACWGYGAACVEVAPSRWSCAPAASEGLSALTELALVLDDLGAWQSIVGRGSKAHIALWAGWNGSDPLSVLASRDGSLAPQACVVDGSQVRPPVRLSGLQLAVSPDVVEVSHASLCGADPRATLHQAMLDLANVVTAAAPPICLGCVGDADPGSPGAQRECHYRAVWRDDDEVRRRALARCEGTAGAWVIPEGEPGCGVTRWGEDLAAACRPFGNAELELHWRGSRPASLGIEPTCPRPEDPLVCGR